MLTPDRAVAAPGARGGDRRALLAWSRVQTLIQLYLVFPLLGLAMASVLYEAAFAVVVAWFDSRRRPTALLAITIVAGFASSVFIPLTGLLVGWYGWRTALVVLASGTSRWRSRCTGWCCAAVQ